MTATSPFSQYRQDGWPLCPQCGEDELYSFGAQPALVIADDLSVEADFTPLTPAEFNVLIQQYIDAGLRCYRCNWELPAKPVQVGA